MAKRYTVDAIDLDDDGEQVWTRILGTVDFEEAIDTVKAAPTIHPAAQYIVSRWERTYDTAPEWEARRFKFDDEATLISDEAFTND